MNKKIIKKKVVKKVTKKYPRPPELTEENFTELELTVHKKLNPTGVGRRSKFSEKLFNEILVMISTTSIGTAKVCHEHNVQPQTFRSWLVAHQPLLEMYQEAKKQQLKILSDEILEISDNDTKDLIETPRGLVMNNVAVQRDKLKIYARQWLLTKLESKTYGDKQEININTEQPLFGNLDLNIENKGEEI